MRWTPLLLGIALLAGCDSAPEPVASEPFEAQEGAIWVDDAEIVLPVVDGRPGAAYMTIRNGSMEDMVLSGIGIEGVYRAELHESSMEGGTMQMAKVAEIAIPSGQSATLERGGLHAMIFGLGTKTDAESMRITLQFADGTTLPVDAIISHIGGMEH